MLVIIMLAWTLQSTTRNKHRQNFSIDELKTKTPVQLWSKFIQENESNLGRNIEQENKSNMLFYSVQHLTQQHHFSLAFKHRKACVNYEKPLRKADM